MLLRLLQVFLVAFFVCSLTRAITLQALVFVRQVGILLLQRGNVLAELGTLLALRLELSLGKMFIYRA